MDPIIVYGIDMAVDAKKRGAVRAYFTDGILHESEVITNPTDEFLQQRIVNDLKSHKVLIAIDAPLGWPIKFKVQEHSAGNFFEVDSLDDPKSFFFQRETERHIKKVTEGSNGKINPLEVTSSFIAGTTYSSLYLIDKINATYCKTVNESKMGCERMVFDRKEYDKPNFNLGVIEVYPSMTLSVLCLPHDDYKWKKKSEIPPEKAKRQNKIKNFISGEVKVGVKKLVNDDVIDAFICLITARSFLNDEVVKPEDLKISPDVYRKEGWIFYPAPEKLT